MVSVTVALVPLSPRPPRIGHAAAGGQRGRRWWGSGKASERVPPDRPAQPPGGVSDFPAVKRKAAVGPRPAARGAEEPRSRRVEEPRSRGAEEPKSRGAEEPRSRGAEEPKSRGAEERRAEEPRSADLKNRGAEEPKSRGVEDSKSRGVEGAGEPKSRGVEDSRSRRAEEPRSRRAEEPRSRRAEEPRSRRLEEPKSRGAEEPKSRRLEEPNNRGAGEPKSRRTEEPRSRRLESRIAEEASKSRGAEEGAEEPAGGPGVPGGSGVPGPPRPDAKRLLDLAHPERWRLTAAVGFLTVSSVITMSAPFFLGRIIDVIYSSPTEDYAQNLGHLCAALSGVFLCGAVANGIRVYLMQTAGQRIVNRLRGSLFSSILKQEVAFFDRTRTGELVNRLSADTALLGRAVTENLSDGLRAVAQASVGVGMMFFVSPSLATFVLGIVPPMSILAVVYGRYLRKLSKATQDSLAQATQLAEERIGNIRTVRAFGKELSEMDKYLTRVQHVLQLAKRDALARAGFFGATGLSGNLIVLAVLYKGGLLMGSAHMTVGELSSFLMYAFWVGLSVGGLSSFYSELMKGLGAGGRLWELLERRPELPFNEGVMLNQKTFRGDLEFRGVRFAYPTRPEVPIFQDFNLSIPAGSVTALVGPSGSGKSTVVSLLLRLYDPEAGTISVDGQDIRQVNPMWLRSNIGTVSQEPVLFSCSIAENIAYGANRPTSVTPADIRKAADVANAAAFIHSFPQGFDTLVGEKGVLLSGGQKQRIAIARALLKNPRILLLDEATSALDAENETVVQEALERLMEGRTVLVIAHRLSTIKKASVVAVLSQGKIIERGKHDQLLSNPNGVYSSLVRKQTFLSADDGGQEQGGPWFPRVAGRSQ
ncbi:ATP-binding cassette sub-family B member 10, mitochondrial [Tachyglossus aculeatus]|uniref:ATP-binding cassette sub-family B member 10, mitochondrial n=1 Tax=Tachyglossus aculeatus TaxID=9261 RepID=UPI0018F57137|nr:ATP-binding cassette sub-family B member 10, mitochondrial [Tachyglossus aculeatus]